MWSLYSRNNQGRNDDGEALAVDGGLFLINL